MRLVTYSTETHSKIAGIIINNYIVDIRHAAKALNIGTAPSQLIEILIAGGEMFDMIALIISKATELLANNITIPWAIDLNKVKLDPPITNPNKIVCIGLNYKDHCKELGVDIPQSPIIFSKFSTSLIGPHDQIVLPSISQQIDPEVELGCVIGKGGKNISEKNALNHVAGYLVFNDVSARDIQFKDKQWVRGKSMDTFAPCGPALVTKDEINDPHNLNIKLAVDGRIQQSSNTNQMIFNIPYLISFLSRSFTWQTGDILSTGTPSGAGVFRDPPIFLQPGNKVVATIEGIGSLKNTCVSE